MFFPKTDYALWICISCLCERGANEENILIYIGWENIFVYIFVLGD